jgi:small subunit ribosomal protein S9
MAIITKGYQATGRRKTSIARVRLVEGSGRIVINGKPMENVLPRATHKKMVIQPLEVTNNTSKFDVFANVNGGGNTGQAGALRMGIARALLKVDIGLRPTLKKGLFLRRDPRSRERKKYGQKGARKRFQYSKR